MNDKILNLITNSLDKVSKEYFFIKQYLSKESSIRERVFCYELYHQMRLIQKEEKIENFTINAEIDKSGHQLFLPEDRKNPDFIIHIPGTMNNYAVIEVKGKMNEKNKRGFLKDVSTLSTFTNEKYKYKLGVLIIFNYSLDEFKKYYYKYIMESMNSKVNINNIIIICKKDSNKSTESEYLENL